MARRRIFFEDNEIKVEDGLGGKRPATEEEILNARVDIPEIMKERWAEILKKHGEKKAALDAARRSKDIRLGRVKPGTAADVPLNEMGAGGWERFVVKNLTNSPELAEAYLQLRGYDVARYGDGFNFAVRKGAGQPWRMLDPRGGADVGWDLLDLTADASMAAAVLAGTAMAGPGGGMAANMFAETAREAAGSAAGVPQGPDTGQITMAGVAGMAVPAVGAILKGPVSSGLNKASKGVVKLSAKIMGTEPDIAMQRAGIKGFGNLGSTVLAAKNIRAQLARFSDDLTPDRQEAQAIIDELEKRGVTVDLSSMIDKMRAMSLGPAGEVSSEAAGLAGIENPAVHALAPKVFRRVKATLAQGGHDETAVPIALAEKIKRSIQKSAARAKVWEEVELDSPSRAFLRDIAAEGRRQVASVADASGVLGPNKGLKYSANMAGVDRTMRIVGAMEESFNSGTTETRRAISAQRAVKALYGDSGTEYLDHLHNFDKIAGTKLAKEAYESSVGKAFGEAGEVGIVPRFTPMGNVLMVGGGAAGLHSGNPAATAAGLAAASPYVNMIGLKTGLGAARLGQSVAEFAKRPLPNVAIRSASQMYLSDTLREIQR